jgi:tetratricopeptide (TPR) repeat protein
MLQAIGAQRRRSLCAFAKCLSLMHFRKCRLRRLDCMPDIGAFMDLRLLIQRALGLHQQGQLDQAAELYGQMLQQEPGNAAALQLLGVLRGQQGRNVEAIKLIEAALAIQPRDFGTLANYGQVLTASGRPQDALGVFDKALAIKPDFFEGLYNKAVALAQLKCFAQAVTSYDKALAVRSDSAD